LPNTKDEPYWQVLRRIMWVRQQGAVEYDWVVAADINPVAKEAACWKYTLSLIRQQFSMIYG